MATTFYQVKNWAHGSLATAVSATATSFVLNSGNGASFPASGTFPAVAYPSDGDPEDGEIVYVTARSTDTLTVTRAQESTTGRAFSSGAIVALHVTAGYMSQIYTAVNTMENGTFGTIGTFQAGTASPAVVIRRSANGAGTGVSVQGQLYNAGSSYVAYGQMQVEIVQNTTGTEVGRIGITAMKNGTATAVMRIGFDASGSVVVNFPAGLPGSSIGTNSLYASSGTVMIGT